MEADPGLVGQAGDPLGSQDRWEGAQHAWQPSGRQDRHAAGDYLAPGDLGTMDDQNRYHGHAWVGQDPGGPVGFERHRAQGGARG